MSTFEVEFTGVQYPNARDSQPRTLTQLRSDVTAAGTGANAAHAEGSRWAFSAPAYCTGTMIKPTFLNQFEASVQAAIDPARQTASEKLVAVQSGMTVREFYLSIDSGADAALRATLPSPPPELTGRRWMLPTLGGAGGQTLAGAISTGTHGGDVARPPLSDAVQAMVVVGSGGGVHLFQRSTRPVRAAVLMAGLHLRSDEFRDFSTGPDADVDELMNAAVVSVGRFGVVYAYVLKVQDETGSAVVEFRRNARWRDVRATLLSDVEVARLGNEFLQVAINPTRDVDDDHACYVTRHKLLPLPPTPPGAGPMGAGNAFGLAGNVESRHVTDERVPSVPPLVGQLLCVTSTTPALENARTTLTVLGFWFMLSPVTWVLGFACFRAADSIARIGPHHLLGDVVADLLNLATDTGLPQIAELVTRATLDSSQTDVRPSDRGPWLVHGTRWEIADFFDYRSTNCYRGDSIEVFFPADVNIPGIAEQIFEVFAELRAQGIPVGGYLSMRFIAPSEALLGMAAAFPSAATSCSIEVAMLRGLRGNPQVLARLQDLAVANGGRVHWGQHNELTSGQVATMYGDRLTRWRRRLAEVEGTNLTFRNAFTLDRGLEPDSAGAWIGWREAGIIAQSSPSAVSNPLEVFVLSAGQVHVCRRDVTVVDPAAWPTIRSEPMGTGATPVAVRGRSGRIEVFVRGTNSRLQHSWEQGRPGGDFSGWETKGDLTVSGDTAVVRHADGRLEIFAQRFPDAGMLHCWALWLDGRWNALEPFGDALGQPSACRRTFVDGLNASDQLVVVASAASGPSAGVVRFKAQTGPAGDSGWHDWADVSTPLIAPGAGSPIVIDVPGGPVRIIAIDASGTAFESIEQNAALDVRWGPWQALPAPPAGAHINADSRLVYLSADRPWLFAVSDRGHVLVTAFESTGWRNWTDIGGDVIGHVAAGVLGDGRIEVFARATDDQIMVRRQSAMGNWP